MSHPILEPRIDEPDVRNGRWMVVIFNNDVTPYDLVIAVLIRATGCSLKEAEIETWEAHHFGKAPVHFAAEDECRRAAAVIASVGVKTEVSPEWQDCPA